MKLTILVLTLVTLAAGSLYLGIGADMAVSQNICWPGFAGCEVAR